jgi:trehalose-6-phosphate synthase
VKLVFVTGTGFPSSEIFQTLPNARTLCESLLKCDLINFHASNHASNFIQTCRDLISSEIFNFKSDQDLLYTLESGHTVIINAIPAGISIEKFQVLLQEEKTKEAFVKLSQVYRNKTVLFGVDRLDYMKSLELKFRAYNLFLETLADEDLRHRSVLVQIAVPCKLYLKEFLDYRSRILGMVSEINKKYASYGEKIVFINEPVDFNTLVAYYTLAEACLVSSQADGCNLVSYEYVVCQQGKEKPGVLILSEFAGVSSVLKSSFVINPFNLDLFADKIRQALRLDSSERRDIQNKLYEASCAHDVRTWAIGVLERVWSEKDSRDSCVEYK